MVGQLDRNAKIYYTYKEQYTKELGLIRKGVSLRNVEKLTGTSLKTLQKVRDMFLAA